MKLISQLWDKFSFVLLIVVIVLAINLNSCVWKQPENQKPTNSPEKITPSPELPSVVKPSTPVKPKYGHFPYRESDAKLMIIISSYAQGENQRFERLAPEAALALMQLIYAARDDGVWIVPVSGFRGTDYQSELFDNQTQKKGSEEAAAKSSAPPGYSEHHTGYAIDLTDGNSPQQDINEQFAETEAFKWLKIHARKFGFELSFPENNFQGVSYEPWHWRFIGSLKAEEIFKIARISIDRDNLAPPTP